MMNKVTWLTEKLGETFKKKPIKNKKLLNRVIIVLIAGFTIGSIMSPKDYTTVDVEKPLSEEIKSTDITFNGSPQTLKSFISNNHEFYNETTGWGKVNHLDWEVQQQRAEWVLDAINSVQFEDKQLSHDLQNIEGLCNIVKKRENSVTVIYLHRIFHDMDKAINNYSHPDAFGMSYTLGVDKKSRFWGDTVFDLEDYIMKYTN